MTQVLRQKAVPGTTDKYEAGRKKHMAWHKAQGDPWAWNVFEITTGPDTGGYIIASANHQWADFDTWTAKFGDGRHGRRRRVDGRHAGVVAVVSYWTQLNSISRLPAADARHATAVAHDLQREAGPRRRTHRGDRQAQRRAGCRANTRCTASGTG